MSDRTLDRLTWIAVAALLTPLGFATKLYSGPGAGWIGGYAGGFLYVLFWVFAVLALAPALRPGAVAACVLAVTSFLEVLQLWHPPLLETVRATFLGHALLGSTFSGWDFVCYAAAAALAPGLARGARVLQRRVRNGASPASPGRSSTP